MTFSLDLFSKTKTHVHCLHLDRMRKTTISSRPHSHSVSPFSVPSFLVPLSFYIWTTTVNSGRHHVATSVCSHKSVLYLSCTTGTALIRAHLRHPRHLLNSDMSSRTYLYLRHPHPSRGEYRVAYQCVPVFLPFCLCALAPSFLAVRRHRTAVRVALAATTSLSPAFYVFSVRTPFYCDLCLC